MDTSSHLLLRGASWNFRRRVPGSSNVIQFPLGTNDRSEAHRLATRVSDEMDSIFERLLRSDSELSDEVVAKYFDFCLRKTTQDLTRRRRNRRMSGKFSENDKRTDEMRLTVMRFMAEDGLSDTLPAHRLTEFGDPDTLELAMEIHTQQYRSVMNSLKFPHFKAAASHVIGSKRRRSIHEGQLLEAYLHASAAAMEAVDGKSIGMGELARDRASKIVAERSESGIKVSPKVTEVPVAFHPSASIDLPPATILTEGVSLIEGPLTHTALDRQFQLAESSNEEIDRSYRISPFSHDLAGVCERSIKRAKSDNKIDDKTADDRRMTIKLFAFLTGLQLVTEIEQHHITLFVKLLKALPLNFLRSAADRDLTYREVASLGLTLPDDKVGRSAGRTNKHLETIGALIKYARIYDKTAVDRDIDISTSRVSETKRARNKRIAFTQEEVTQLFRHPIWTGCKSKERRQEAGTEIIQDGLYWIPLIVTYTGARIEEIAGLPVSSIQKNGEHWGIDIAPHNERRLKNLQSERLLPIHDHLIELGLIRHYYAMKKNRRKFMFPELEPTGKSPFSRKMKYNFDKARDIQLGGRAEVLTMHSLRHRVNITLKSNRNIEKSVRMDILGHAAEDLNEEVYSEGTPFFDKLMAINSIPRAF